MTFDEIWEQLKRKDDKLADESATVSMSAGNLRKLLRQTYEQGQKSVPQKHHGDSGMFGEFADLFGRRS